MKTIEERAKEYAPDVEGIDWEEVHNDSAIVEYERAAFIAGAKSEHALLTEWHELDENGFPNGEFPQVLVKLKYVGEDENTQRDFPYSYEIGEVEPASLFEYWRFQYPSKYDRDYEFVGWRKIHE